MAWFVAVLTILLLTFLSLRASQRFKDQARLPMQWSIRGSVNWTAPRRFALAFMPVVGAICLFPMAAAATFLRPRPGQEELVIPVTIAVALGLIAIHLLHLWLMQRTIQRKP